MAETPAFTGISPNRTVAVAACGHTGVPAFATDSIGLCPGDFGVGGVTGFTGTSGLPSLDTGAALAGSAPGAMPVTAVVTDSTSPTPALSHNRRRAMYPPQNNAT